MRNQGCREKIEWVKENCGGSLSPAAVDRVKKASEFVKRKAPYLENVATDAVHALRVIEDPIIQGKVLSMAKEAIETKKDPRTGRGLKHGLSLPIVLWMIEYARTGERSAVIPTRKQFEFNKENIELLKIMREGGVDLCRSRGQADTAYKLDRFCARLLKGVA